MSALIRKDALVFSRTAAAVGSLVGGGSILPAVTNSVNASNLATYNFAMGVFGPYSGFYFLLANHTATPALVDNACGGATSTAYPGGVFNIALPESGWSAPTGPITIPAATGTTQAERNKRPGLALSPLIGVKSIPRAAGELDGGKTELVVGRVAFLASNTNGPYGDLGNNFPALWDPTNDGISVLTSAVSYGVDSVTTPSNVVTSTRETLPALAIVGIVPVYDQPMVCIGGPGDSITAGMTNTSAFGVPYAFKVLARLRAAGRFVTYFQGGISGSPQTAIAARARELANLDMIDIMPLTCYTINSAVGTQKDWDAQWALTLSAIQTQLNRRPTNQVLLQTPLPNDSFNAAQNGFRAKQRLRCLALAGSMPRVGLVDFDTITNVANGHFKYPEDTVEGTHMTDAGNEKAAVPFRATLERML